MYRWTIVNAFKEVIARGNLKNEGTTNLLSIFLPFPLVHTTIQ